MAKANGEAKSGGGQSLDMPQAKAFRADPDTLTIIGRDTEHKKGEHPNWDKRCKNHPQESKVLAMIRYGWHGAITVAKDGDMTVVVDGKQRVIAAREANRRLAEAGEERRILPVCLPPVKGEDSTKTAILAMMNEHRTVDDMIERARKMENMLRFDATVADVAIAFGETEQTVKNCLKTLECHGDIIKAAERGEVAPSVLIVLSALSRDDQMAEFEKMKAEGKLTVAEAQRRTYNKKNGTSKGEPTDDSGNGKKLPVPVVRKILALYDTEKLESDLDPMIIQMLKLFDGKVKPSAIKGMTAVLRQVGYIGE